MAQRQSEKQGVPVTIRLPPELYFWIEYAARQKGLAVSTHIEEWIIQFMPPWDTATGSPRPLEASSVHGTETPTAPSRSPQRWVETGPKPAEYPDRESFLKVVRAERNARVLETRRRNRVAQPKVIPDHIKAIAKVRKQYPKLPLRALSQLLYDQDIYQSNRGTPGKACPVNAATLSVWLRRARDAGLLPK